MRRGGDNDETGSAGAEASRQPAKRTRPEGAMRRRSGIQSSKPLLSIEETALLLGMTRSTLYRAVNSGRFPLAVFRIGGRLLVARRAVERLLEGLDPATELRQSDAETWGGTMAPASPSSASRRPTCSAARRSSAGTPSV